MVAQLVKDLKDQTAIEDLLLIEQEWADDLSQDLAVLQE